MQILEKFTLQQKIKEIIDDVKKNGGQAILTDNNHKTGTDRIYEALKKLGKTDVELVMNLTRR